MLIHTLPVYQGLTPWVAATDRNADSQRNMQRNLRHVALGMLYCNACLDAVWGTYCAGLEVSMVPT